MNRNLRMAVFAALVGAALVARAEPAVTVKAIDLKQTPASDGKSLGPVRADTPVDLVKREGAWVQIRAGNITGWAKLFDVRLAAAGGPAKSGGGSVTETLNLAAGNRGSSATTGVRGLDEEMLKRAAPAPQELAQVDRNAVNKAQAENFAKNGRLVPRTVEPVPAAGKGASK